MSKATVFKRARLNKSQSKPSIDNWTDLFASKNLMSIIVPTLHLYDIIHLAMTSKRLLAFYGTKLTTILCVIVKRDCGGVYINPPLRYLGKDYNVRQTPEGLYSANRCCMCSSESIDLVAPIAAKCMCCAHCRQVVKERCRALLYQEAVKWILNLVSSEDRARVRRLIYRSLSGYRFGNFEWASWLISGKSRTTLMRDYFVPLFSELQLSLYPEDLISHLKYQISIAEFLKHPKIIEMTPGDLMESAKRIIDSIEW
ncbi:MAG: hypothetical protein H0X02_10715 [Nitrosomonas sp.]|nr:hypothetical protein [Nitrosomonas sp.]